MTYRSYRRAGYLCAALALSCAALAANAQQQAAPTVSGHHDMPANTSGAGGMSAMPGMSHPGDDSSASTQAFKQGGERMMKRMDAPVYTGDADKDFVAHMIPHHEGAVDMARVELKYGKDPAMRRLARDIIAAQKKEIAMMKRWQASHGVR